MADVTITERTGFGLAAILPRKGIAVGAIGVALGGEMPLTPRASEAAGLTVIGMGPGQWLAYAAAAGPNWTEDLTQRLDGLAHVSPQSGAYRLWQLAGADAATPLRRCAAVDIDRMAVGDVAATSVAHISVLLRRLPDADSGQPNWHIACGRSSGEDLAHVLETTALHSVSS